jgi:hypothetical protein
VVVREKVRLPQHHGRPGVLRPSAPTRPQGQHHDRAPLPQRIDGSGEVKAARRHFNDFPSAVFRSTGGGWAQRSIETLVDPTTSRGKETAETSARHQERVQGDRATVNVMTLPQRLHRLTRP